MRIALFLKYMLLTTQMSAVAFAEENTAQALQEAHERPVFVTKFGDSFSRYTGVAVTLVPRSQMDFSEGNKVKIFGRVLGNDENLCDDDPYVKEVKYGFCSGCLIGPDVILTARHCIDRSLKCNSAMVVFDFKDNDVTKENVFECTENIPLQNNYDADIAIFKIDRSRSSLQNLSIRRSSKLQEGEELLMIGSPLGMYQSLSLGKVSGFANNPSAIGNPGNSDPIKVVKADLPSFHSNSGSCVFNKKTGELEGVLTTGAKELEYDINSGCYRTIPASKMVQKSGRAYSEIVPTATFLVDLDNEISNSKSRQPKTYLEKTTVINAIKKATKKTGTIR